MEKISLSSGELRALVEALRKAEYVKPSQAAKRAVFKEYGIAGSKRDELLTAVFYSVLKRQGVIDRIVARTIGFDEPSDVLVLDPWLRSALRLAAELLYFREPTDGTRHELRWKVADFISKKTHPYTGMFYWRIFDKLAAREYQPRTEEEKLELELMLPAWLVGKILRMLGPQEGRQLLKSLNSRLPLSVRVNTLRARVAEVLEELRREGVSNPTLSPRVPTIIRFDGPFNFDNSRLFRKGKIVVQEEAAAYASIALDPKPGETVADLAAAPGGKTQHMAELMRNRGVIYAFDVDEARIKRMRQLLRRTGVSITRIYNEDARRAPEILGEESVDKVMLDAPCTSTGTIMKNPELRWRVKEESIAELVQLQREMLEAGARLLKPGGRLLYTTCSLFPEENEENVKWLLSRREDVKLVPLHGPYDEGFLPGTMRAWPHRHMTIGFFYALIEKKGEK